MKRKKVLIICFAIVVALLAVTAFAILTDNDSAINNFSVGQNEIKITEAFQPPDDIIPGETYTKAPSVTNTNNVNCYVRMYRGFGDESVASYTKFGYNNVFTPDYNTADWEYNTNDDYYYYKHVLEPGQTTTPLFDAVKTLLENEDTSEPISLEDVQDYDVIIYAESVQAAEYSNYQAAWNAFIPSTTAP